MKIKLFYPIAISICGFLSFSSCKKNNNSCKNYTPPNSLFFQIIESGEKLPDNILKNLKLYYTKNNTKIYITDLNLAIEVFANKGIMTTRNIGTLGANNYVLEYGNGFLNDTAYIEYSDATPATDCRFQLKKVVFNNEEVSANNSFGYQPVYIFYKK